MQKFNPNVFTPTASVARLVNIHNSGFVGVTEAQKDSIKKELNEYYLIGCIGEETFKNSSDQTTFKFYQSWVAFFQPYKLESDAE